MELWFVFRKFLSSVLYPPNFFLLLALVGIILAWLPSKRKTGLLLSSISLLMLFLLSLPLFVQPLIARWESQYPPLSTENLSEKNLKWIVVLGSGSRTKDSPEDPSTAGLQALSQTRAVEGIRLATALPSTRLIFMGAAIEPDFSGARAMADLALALGIPEDRILVVVKPTSTWEEAKEAKLIVDSETVILVTSAVHLPRAMRLFEKAGITTIPAPTDFLSERNQRLTQSLLISPHTWVIWQRLFHEMYGRVWSVIYSSPSR